MAYLTDKEKRLLFSALTREKKVCVEVDKECCRETCEDTLESVVKNLEKKFYYDRFEKEIRAKAIDEFAKWCYINGIDFSYMAKATDTEPFCERVVRKFNEEQLKDGVKYDNL